MNRVVLNISVIGTIIFCIPSTTAMAIDTNSTEIVYDTYGSQTRAAGLISSYNLSISKATKMIKLNGNTLSNNTMKSIGYKDVVIEYSSDNVNWYTEKNIGDLLQSNDSSYYLNSYSVSVKGGYYYRVTCTHYAKESGLFGSSQSVDNTSNSVWIN